MVFSGYLGKGTDKHNAAEEHGQRGQGSDDQGLGGVGQEGEAGEVHKIEGQTGADQTQVNQPQGAGGEIRWARRLANGIMTSTPETITALTSQQSYPGLPKPC